MPLTAKQIISLIESKGWYFHRQNGSHRIFIHDKVTGLVIVPMHKGDLKIGTERDILRQAGLR